MEKKSLEPITVFTNVAAYKINKEINYIIYILAMNTRIPKLKYNAIYKCQSNKSNKTQDLYVKNYKMWTK